jgi:ribose 5-phosphate isomerase B
MIIHIGSDHAGFDMKAKVIAHLQSAGHEVIDHGTFSADSVDYPDFAHPVASAVEAVHNGRGILLCGSANGVCITANKHAGIRAALCWNPEIASLARQHNDANILGIPARFVDEKTALKMTDVFLGTNFEGGRHQQRVDKIAC